MYFFGRQFREKKLLANAILEQRFFETLQYCDEWRKFISVSQSSSESYTHFVNFRSGYDCEHVA